MAGYCCTVTPDALQPLYWPLSAFQWSTCSQRVTSRAAHHQRPAFPAANCKLLLILSGKSFSFSSVTPSAAGQ